MAEVRPHGSASSGPADAAPVPFIDLVAQHRTIEGEVMEAVRKVFSSQAFIMGEEVAALEAEVADYCDAREAIGCASGTDALILALMALGVGPGDEVITTPFTFFATASCVTRLGATPVFVDIDPVSYNLDPVAVEAAVTPRTKAILPVHIFGQTADMDPIQRTAAKHGIPIVEDACQAIGAEYRGRRAGVLGTIACFSFFPTKNLGGAGDGGIITTDDPDLAKRMRRLRVHGDAGGYNHLEVGLNSRLDALQAAVLRVKLRHLDAWTAGRQRNAERYARQFAATGMTAGLVPPATLPERRHVFNQYVTRVPGRRDEVLAAMRSQSVGAMVYYPIPLHLQKCFEHLGYRKGDLPVAELACREVLALPIYTELPADHQARVIDTLRTALGGRAAQPLRRAA